MPSSRRAAPAASVPRVLSDRVVYIATGDLRQHPQNPNRGNVDAIVRSIEANGFFGALVVQQSTGYVLAGNHRLDAAIALAMPTVPVLYVEVDDATAKRILLADNRTAELAYRDPAAVLAILDEIGAHADTLAGVGFSLDDVEELRRLTRTDAERASAGPVVTAGAQHFDVLVTFHAEGAQREFFERMQHEGRECRLLL